MKANSKTQRGCVMAKNPRVLIEVEGGNLVVFSDVPVDVHIVEHGHSDLPAYCKSDLSAYPRWRYDKRTGGIRVDGRGSDQVYHHSTDGEVAPKFIDAAMRRMGVS